jgi:hypothetical protein
MDAFAALDCCALCQRTMYSTLFSTLTVVIVL